MNGSPPSVLMTLRAYRSALVLLFLAGIWLPLIDWKFKLDRTPELTENRVAAPTPSWPKNGAEWRSLSKAVENYWNDAFGFRRRLIRWHALAKYELGVSPTPLVAIGKGRWLFYTGNESIEQRRGLRPFSSADLDAWAKQLEARDAWLARRGAHFLFVVVPDKQTIYPEAVPDRYGPLARTPLDQLVEHLRAHSHVSVLDLRTALRDAQAGGEVYHHTDSHWNDRGAYAGYVAIVNQLRAWYPRLAPRAATSFERHVSKPWNGDLALMIGGAFEALSERSEEWQPVPAVTVRWLSPGDYPASELGLHALLENPGRESLPRAVVFHDSFLLSAEERAHSKPFPLRALPPPPSTFMPRALLAEQFSRVAFSWHYAFDWRLVENEHPDLVIEEHSERLIRRGPQGAVPSQ